MATLTISLVSAPLTGSKTFNGTDADVTKLIAYLQRFYPGTTPQQALVAWANDWIKSTINNEQSANITQTVPPPMGLS